jgi:predicted RNA-binding protein associated with RNAse of E/G family
VKWLDGSVRVVDRESLQRAAAEGVVSGELASRALAVATQLESKLRGIAQTEE